MTRHLVFLFVLALCLTLFAPVWADWGRLLLQDKRYSYSLVIPAISACLIYMRRRRVFHAPTYDPRAGLPLLVVGVILYAAIGSVVLTGPGALAAKVFAALLACTAAFAFVYGRQALFAAEFPLLFLLLIIPIPPGMLDKTLAGLQNASAETTLALFRLTGEVVHREGYVFSLPGVVIEIDRQCSGLRTTQACFIAGILLGRLFLRSGWRILCLTVCTIPIAIFTNAVRISTMALLAVHGHPGFLYGDLHDYSGRMFVVLSLSLITSTLLLLQRSERSHRHSTDGQPNPAAPVPYRELSTQR